ELDVRKRRLCFREMFGQRPAGQEVHLEGTDHPLRVARLNASRRLHIDALQQSMQALGPATIGDGLEPPAKVRVAPGSGKEAARESAIVKAGPTDDDRKTMPRVDISDGRGRIARELR